ncbi:MAG TPA: hypothetical protein VK514_02645 [Candidatus Acidoferrum sp.]|nr:hypothetical protein [Candidatus Acidoferrum sp.]
MSLLDSSQKQWPKHRVTPIVSRCCYLTTFVFDVPADAGHPRLLVDHENTPLHGEIYLALNLKRIRYAVDLR